MKLNNQDKKTVYVGKNIENFAKEKPLNDTSHPKTVN